MDKPTKRQLIESLRSPVCPACANTKKVRQSFCNYCYGLLPHRVKRALFQHIGNGYEDAFDEALAHLGVTVPVWPEEDEIEDGFSTGTKLVGTVAATYTIADHASSALDRVSSAMTAALDGFSDHAAAIGRWADDGGAL